MIFFFNKLQKIRREKPPTSWSTENEGLPNQGPPLIRSSEKKKNYSQPKWYEMPNRITPLAFYTVLFVPSFLSYFKLSPCLKSESFPSFSDCCCFFLPLLSFCHLVMGMEAQSQKWSSWIPFAWHSELQEQPACPKPLPATLPLAAPRLFYFPFFLSLKVAQISISR